jgi:2-iminobutanoate/2-iminopropanoate deaminase
MDRIVVTSERVPRSTSPLSPAIKAGDYLFVSGQVGANPTTRETMKGIEEHSRQCLENIKAILTAGGTSLDKVVKVTVFMTNIKDFAMMNDVYRTYFPTNPPAHSCIEVKSLAREGLEIEIECVAAI